MSPDIYWIPGAAPARLALMPRPRSGEWLADEVSAWRRAEIGTVVSLLETAEVRELALSDEAALCRDSGIEFLSFPIADRGTPVSLRDTASLVDGLAARLLRGVAVAVHCRAGIGRSALISGCALFRLGVPLDEIFPALAQARGLPVPDTPEQTRWLADFAREYGRASLLAEATPPLGPAPLQDPWPRAASASKNSPASTPPGGTPSALPTAGR
jgi:hypothetical protein